MERQEGRKQGTVMTQRTRRIYLCFRGFDLHPDEVELLIGHPASLTLERGQPVRPGMRSLAVRSAVSYQIDATPTETLTDMTVKLLNALGGIEHLKQVKDSVKPEFVEIDFVLPNTASKVKIGEELDAKAVALIASLGASVAISPK